MSSHSSPIRVLLVDDHALFLAGVRSLIQSDPGVTIVGEATNKDEALKGAAEQPDLILLDLDLGDQLSLDFLPELLQISEKSRVLIMTGLTDPELHLRAVRLGAAGVVSKVAKADSFLMAIRKVHSGEAWLNRSMVAAVVTDFAQRRKQRKPDPEEAKIASLTARELEVITCLSGGLRNKQIGERLFISEKTVRHYFTSIFDKLGVSDRLELIIYAYKHGLTKLPTTFSADRDKMLSA
jgi:two-component system, NarL family, nitrate/nitrite response regulator NarL